MRRCSTSAFVRKIWSAQPSRAHEAFRTACTARRRRGRPDPCDDDLIIIEEDNLEALSRGTDMTPNEAWTDAVAAMGPARARMFSSDADDVEPVPGLGLGLGID